MNRREFNLRLFGTLYFPFQFLLVWVLLFGFTAYPNMAQVWRGFGLSGVVGSALEFAALAPFKLFTTDKLIKFIILMIPYAIKVVLSCWRILLFVFVCWQLVQFIIAEISAFARKNATLNDSANVIVKIGAPGSGKSSSAGAEAVYRAAQMWRKLKFDYWQYSNMLDRWRASENLEKIQEWYEIRDAFEFYNSRPECIPCLWSNIPIKDLYGRIANELTVDFLYQKKRLPAFSILYVDEIGSMIDLDLYKDKPWDLDNMFRFCRHFGNFVLIATEQSAENIYINCRRVVAYNEYMLKQKWVCKPYPLMIVYALLKKILPRMKRGAKRFAPFLAVLNDMVRHIGFRKYTYTYEGNTERTASLYRGGRRTFYLYSCLNYFYNDRTYRNYYLAKDYLLEAHIYKSMILDTETEAGKRYLRMREALDRAEAERKAEARSLLKALLISPATANKVAFLIQNYSKLNHDIAEALKDKELFDALKRLTDTKTAASAQDKQPPAPPPPTPLEALAGATATETPQDREETQC